MSDAPKLRHYCRNTHCRSKLPVPAENGNHAFCARGCHAVFYRTRCQVCEEPIRRKNERQTTCFGSKCKSLRRRFPDAYSWPEWASAARASLAPQEVPILRGSKPASNDTERPRHRCLRTWAWAEADCELELHDAGGELLARLEHNRGRYRLTHPRTYPIQSWADEGLAKRGAESFALMNLPVDSATAARAARENSRPHPMAGPSLGAGAAGVESQFAPEASLPPDADPWAVPDFLKRSVWIDWPADGGAS